MEPRILISFYRRWWIPVLLCTLAQIAFSAFAPHEQGLVMLMPLFLFLGPLALSFDLAKGSARILQLLPVNRATLRLTWWGMAVGFPTVWVFVITLVGLVVRLLFNPAAALALPYLVQTTVIAFVGLSLLSFLLTGLPTSAQEHQARSVKGIIFSMLWGASIGGSMLLAHFLDFRSDQISPYNLPCVMAGCLFSYFGYIRTDEMLTLRATGRFTTNSNPSLSHRPVFELKTSATGFRYFAQTALQQILTFTVLFLIFSVLFQTVIPRNTGLSSLDWTSKTIRGQLGLLAILPIFMQAAKLTAVRVFRTLPITASQLSHKIHNLTLLILGVQAAIIFLVISLLEDVVSGLDAARSLIALGGLGTLLIPTLLRFGLRPMTFALIFPLFIIASLSRFFWADYLTPGLLFGAAIITMIIARSLTTYLLKNSSHAYRQVVHPSFGMMNPYGKG
jgi:hypothetical protein